jgi:hypothetical protein
VLDLQAVINPLQSVGFYPSREKLCWMTREAVKSYGLKQILWNVRKGEDELLNLTFRFTDGTLSPPPDSYASIKGESQDQVLVIP